MVGIPDGLGVRNAATGGKAELFMNHELVGTAGAVRAHGQKGSFVSNYRIDKTTLAVESGRDLIDAPADLTFFNYPTGTYNAPGPNRRLPWRHSRRRAPHSCGSARRR